MGGYFGGKKKRDGPLRARSEGGSEYLSAQTGVGRRMNEANEV